MQSLVSLSILGGAGDLGWEGSIRDGTGRTPLRQGGQKKARVTPFHSGNTNHVGNCPDDAAGIFVAGAVVTSIAIALEFDAAVVGRIIPCINEMPVIGKRPLLLAVIIRPNRGVGDVERIAWVDYAVEESSSLWGHVLLREVTNGTVTEIAPGGGGGEEEDEGGEEEEM